MLQKTRTNKEIVDNDIGAYNVYSMYIPDLKLNKAIKSPFRSERNPSFLVKVLPDGKLYHRDFSDDRYKGDFIDFVRQVFSLDYHGALKKIISDSGTGCIETPVKAAPILKPKEHSVIVPARRSFTKRDLDYWQQFGFGIKDLIKEGIYSLESFTLDGRQMYQRPDELAFVYKFPQGWKVYFPERTDFKWFSSVPNHWIEGWENVKHFDYLFITKSRKDRMVLSKIYDNVLNSQNESVSLLDGEVAKQFKNFKKVFVIFDCDDPGLKALDRVVTETGWTGLTIPRSLYDGLDIKDPAEWVNKSGYRALTRYLKDVTGLTPN